MHYLLLETSKPEGTADYMIMLYSYKMYVPKKKNASNQHELWYTSSKPFVPQDYKRGCAIHPLSRIPVCSWEFMVQQVAWHCLQINPPAI
jgi:hypothetical protein